MSGGLTVSVEALLKNLLDGLLRGLEAVLHPLFSVVGAEDDDLALLAAQRGEVRHLRMRMSMILLTIIMLSQRND